MSTAFRFLHSADMHLGRRFGSLPEDIRGRLIEARHQILSTLAQTARDNGAQDILLAGDTFDTHTPSDPVWRQALSAIGAQPDLNWWVIPGNHDSLAAETLWSQIAAHGPANLHVIDKAAPVQMRDGVTLLPAPLPRRHSPRDLTDWMPQAATPEGHLRIGLAHGPVQDFSQDGDNGGTIAPDRADTAGLDYLALGDWHGQMRLGPRTAYSGTPEADGFRHDGRGACLLVSIDAPRATPEITPVPTGRFHWRAAELGLVPGQDSSTALHELLPGASHERRDWLLKLRVTGRATLKSQHDLRETAAQIGPEFCHFAMDVSALETEIDAHDLDALDHGGALRQAAQDLATQASDSGQSESARRIAGGALNRLYSLLSATP